MAEPLFSIYLGVYPYYCFARIHSGNFSPKREALIRAVANERGGWFSGVYKWLGHFPPPFWASAVGGSFSLMTLQGMCS